MQLFLIFPIQTVQPIFAVILCQKAFQHSIKTMLTILNLVILVPHLGLATNHQSFILQSFHFCLNLHIEAVINQKKLALTMNS
jgi:hypothetical protein